MTDIIAQAVCDSIPSGADSSLRLLTMFTRSPTFNHQETLRHRKIYIQDNLALDFEPDFSFSVSSSRAIPFIKRLEEASDPQLLASPVFWGEEQKGMLPGPEIDDSEHIIFWPNVMSKLGLTYPKPAEEWITKRECAKRLWELGAYWSAKIAELLVEITQCHKTYPNRMIATYIHTNALLTATAPGWLNFFGLRLDQAADPTLRALAEACWWVWNESCPRQLWPGEWHLPYANDDQSITDVNVFWEQFQRRSDTGYDGSYPDITRRISVARCARLSYLSFETQKRSTVEEDLKLYQRLVGSLPIHASPAEHQATPDTRRIIGSGPHAKMEWDHPGKGGNLGPGWIQFRKLLPNEAVAALPAEYQS